MHLNTRSSPLILLALGLCSAVTAQAPQRLNYAGMVIENASGRTITQDRGVLDQYFQFSEQRSDEGALNLSVQVWGKLTHGGPVARLYTCADATGAPGLQWWGCDISYPRGYLVETVVTVNAGRLGAALVTSNLYGLPLGRSLFSDGLNTRVLFEAGGFIDSAAQQSGSSIFSSDLHIHVQYWAHSMPYGQSCSQHRLVRTQLAKNSADIAVRGLATNEVAMLLVAVQQRSVSLAGLGAAGCNLLVPINEFIPVPMSRVGSEARATLRKNSFYGSRWETQGLVLSPGINRAGLVTTNGLGLYWWRA